MIILIVTDGDIPEFWPFMGVASVRDGDRLLMTAKVPNLEDNVDLGSLAMLKSTEGSRVSGKGSPRVIPTPVPLYQQFWSTMPWRSIR